jgi:hypothetical protein
MFRLLLPLAALALAACAAMPGPQSVRPGEPSDQVRARLSAPALERKLPTGETAWFYPTGPGGFTTWRVVVGPDGKVVRYDQVLTMANFLWMREGRTRDEVLDRVGPPFDRMSFRGTATEAWSYRWLDGTFEMIAEPVFDAPSGVVKYVGIFRDPAFSSTPGSMK